MKTTETLKSDFWGILDIQGVITIASRLKRLSDLFYQQAQEVYDSRSRNFKTSWFSVLATIKQNREIDFKTLANKNNVSNSAISQVIRELEKLEYVSIKTGIDKRSRLITLTESGDQALASIVPDLIDIEMSLKQLLGDKAGMLLELLETTEDKLRQTSFYDMLQVEVDEYTDIDKNDFVKLNKAWLNQYFNEEETDKEFFNDPEKYTTQKGGKIFIAKSNNKIVGTVSLIPHENGRLEISKLTTHEDYRNRGIAQKLLNRSMIFANASKFKELFAESNSQLKEAINLYNKNNFSCKDYSESRYDRVDIIFRKSVEAN